MNAVKELVETKTVNEMRGAFGIPAKISVAGLWAVVRGEARQICARAEPLPGQERQFEKFLEAVRKSWQRPEPPPTHGEVSFLASLCGKSGLGGDQSDCCPEQIGRFLYVFMRFVNFTGSFPKITVADLDSLQFSMHLEMVPKKADVTAVMLR